MAGFKDALLLGLAPKNFIVAVGIGRRVNVDQIHAGIGQLGELFLIVAAMDDAGVEEGGGFGRFAGGARTVAACQDIENQGGKGWW